MQRQSNNEVAKINPMFTKVSTPLDLLFKIYFAAISLKSRVEMTMIGVALITLLLQFPHHSIPGCFVLDVPTSFPFLSNTSYPFFQLFMLLIKIRSQYLLKQQLRNGTIYQESFSCLVLMTLMKFNPKATEHEAETANV